MYTFCRNTYTNFTIQICYELHDPAPSTTSPTLTNPHQPHQPSLPACYPTSLLCGAAVPSLLFPLELSMAYGGDPYRLLQPLPHPHLAHTSFPSRMPSFALLSREDALCTMAKQRRRTLALRVCIATARCHVTRSRDRSPGI